MTIATPAEDTRPKRSYRRDLLLFGLLGVIIAAVFALQGSAYATRMLVEAAAYAIIAIGLNIQWGYAGLFNVGVMGFIMAGAFASVLFTFPVNPAFWASEGAPMLGEALGSEALSVSILANEDWAWVAIVIVTAWQSIPATMLIYIAGLVTIPADVYEAASIDGATGRQSLWHITLPLVSGFVVINTILGFKNYLNAYDIIVGLTDGGPGVATRSVAMSIFRGFEGGDYAYQMANAMVFFLISIALAGLQLRLTRGRTVL